MWNSLYGEVTHRGEDHVHLLVGGSTEWNLHVSGTTLASLLYKGDRVRIFTHLIHKEDDMTIYGFSAEPERAMFLQLLSVNGVGAKAALRVLSTFNPERLQDVLESDDINALASVKGLGKKTAQKILLALKGKLVWTDEASGEFAWLNDISQSLIAMGFESKKVQAVLKDVTKTLDLANASDAEREQQVFGQAVLVLSQGAR